MVISYGNDNNYHNYGSLYHGEILQVPQKGALYEIEEHRARMSVAAPALSLRAASSCTISAPDGVNRVPMGLESGRMSAFSPHLWHSDVA
jgi:hypothetical protein